MNTFDVIIIGSGPIGAICANRLAQAGLNILLLEAGKIVSKPPGSHLHNQSFYQNHPDNFMDEIIRWSQFYPSNGLADELPGANISVMYGGQGLLWYNNCPRPSLHELWPVFNTEKWDKNFREAEKSLFVNTDLFDDSIRQQKIFNKLSQFFHQKKLKRIIKKLPVAGKKQADGHIHFIATNDILENVGKIHIKCDTKVLSLKLQHDEIHSVIVQTPQHSIKEIKAPYVIVAAGVFNTPKLLYDSFIRPSALGKYLHYHPICCAQLILSNDLCATQDHADMPFRLFIPPTPDYPWHGMLVRHIFSKPSLEKIHENQLLECEFFSPLEIQSTNQMFLDEPMPRFHVALSEKDKKTIENMQIDLREIAAQLGKFRQGCEPEMKAPGFAHPMGTYRMGDNPTTSVTNHKGQVHGIKNLFLAGVGLIPSPIAVNPTLTAAALAIETIEHIVKKMEGKQHG